MVNQGEIYNHLVAGARYRVVVVSSDAHNATGRPAWIAPVRHGGIDAPPYLVVLADTDPLGGAVDIDRMIRAVPAGEAIGLLTGATVERVRQAINTLFAG